MNNAAFNRLRSELCAAAAQCGLSGCPLDNESLEFLLREYPDGSAALYMACLYLSRDSSLKLGDGTQSPSQSRYWLRLAMKARPSHSHSICRLDFAFGGGGDEHV